jgi:5-methylthioadenosine/S-adenosylhomocysteine deaminase
VDRDRAHLMPDADPWSTLVYAARGTDVRMTMVDGDILVDGFALARMDATAIAAEARQAARDVALRAGL